MSGVGLLDESLDPSERLPPPIGERRDPSGRACSLRAALAHGGWRFLHDCSRYPGKFVGSALQSGHHSGVQTRPLRAISRHFAVWSPRSYFDNPLEQGALIPFEITGFALVLCN